MLHAALRGVVGVADLHAARRKERGGHVLRLSEERRHDGEADDLVAFGRDDAAGIEFAERVLDERLARWRDLVRRREARVALAVAHVALGEQRSRGFEVTGGVEG